MINKESFTKISPDIFALLLFNHMDELEARKMPLTSVLSEKEKKYPKKWAGLHLSNCILFVNRNVVISTKNGKRQREKIWQHGKWIFYSDGIAGWLTRSPT